MILEVMNTIYDWVDAVINNPDDINNPNLTIIPSHKNISPSNCSQPYLTIDYAPALSTLGKADWDIEEEGGLCYNKLRTDYEGTVEIWETNGIGEYLVKLVSSQWIQEVNDYLRENYISILRNNGVVTMPYTQHDKKWKRESVVEFIFGFGAGLRYEIDNVEDIEATGTLIEQDGSEKTVVVTKDSP